MASDSKTKPSRHHGTVFTSQIADRQKFIEKGFATARPDVPPPSIHRMTPATLLRSLADLYSGIATKLETPALIAARDTIARVLPSLSPDEVEDLRFNLALFCQIPVLSTALEEHLGLKGLVAVVRGNPTARMGDIEVRDLLVVFLAVQGTHFLPNLRERLMGMDLTETDGEVREKVSPLLHTLVIDTATGSKEPASKGLIGLGLSHPMLIQDALLMIRASYPSVRDFWYNASALVALVEAMAPPHATPGV